MIGNASSLANRLATRLRHARDGVASIEFMFLAPVMMVMILSVIDLGNVLYTRFRLTDGVAAASSYAIARSSDVSTANATDLARSMATLVGNSNGTGWANATVTVNNGPVGTNNGGSASATTTNTATTNGLCYCPNSITDFGAQKVCGVSCGNGGIAGRYVVVTAKRKFVPVFSSYGATGVDGYVSVSNMVQTG